MTRVRPVDLPETLYSKLAQKGFNIFYNAPLLIMISGQLNKPWMAEECALAGQNMMLWAHADRRGVAGSGLVCPI